MLHELAAARQTIRTGEDAGVSGTVDNPIDLGQSGDVTGTTQIAMNEVDAPRLKAGAVQLATAASQVVQPGDFPTQPGFCDSPAHRATYKSAGSGEEKMHLKIWGNSSRRDGERLSILLSAFNLPLLLRRLDNLPDGFLEGDGDIPTGIVAAHFGEVGDVADVVADPVFVEILKHLRLAGDAFGDGEGFEDGAGVGTTAPDVVDFGDAGRGNEGRDELGDVVGVDVVADLLAFVAEDFVFPAFEVALHEVGQKAMQFDP